VRQSSVYLLVPRKFYPKTKATRHIPSSGDFSSVAKAHVFTELVDQNRNEHPAVGCFCDGGAAAVKDCAERNELSAV
jgi:hypothetical protein